MKNTLVAICALIASASCQRSDRQDQQTLPVLPPPVPTADPGTPNPPPAMEPSLSEQRVNMSGTDEDTAHGNAELGTSELGSSELRSGEPGSATDRAITQRIRQSLMDDGAFSGSAKNVEIRTVDGVVTLRGPIRTSQERSHLTTLASGVEGVKRVDNQLRIARE